MPFQDVMLAPGVNVERTLELNQAAISACQLIRFKGGLPQKLGGWTPFYATPVSSTPVRDVHAWQGLQSNKMVAAGSLTGLVVISSGALLNITPQTNATTPVPSFSVEQGSNIVTVVDPGSSVGPYMAVRFDTYVAVGGIVLSSAYAVNTAIDENTYTIAADFPATETVSSGGVLPTFQATAGQSNIEVTFPSAGFQQAIGLFYPFRAPTVVGSVTIEGNYEVSTILDSTSFDINAGMQASTTSSVPVPMNGGRAALQYFNTQGPPALAGAFGAGLFGVGLFGLGTPPGSGQGTPITADDWCLDNFGEYLVAIPKNQPIYYWSPDLGYSTAQVIANLGAPLFNIGGFVSQPQMIVMVFGSTQTVSGAQDPLLIRWSDSAALMTWIPTTTNDAGSFRIPTGSALIGGLQAPLMAVFWTDIDIWVATWAGQPLIWSFQQVGTGCGLIGMHAADVQNGVVYWCGPSNFYMLGAGGVTVIPCTVWDFFFQQIDIANQSKVRAASNSYFSEISWFFPLSPAAAAAAGITYTGENNAYVKLHIDEMGGYQWDYGYLSRTAWVDTTVVGPPIGADANGNLLQHETSFDAAGTPILSSLDTGYFEIGDGTQLPLVDWCLPDIRWGALGQPATQGTLYFTFFATDYPGEAEQVIGPFAVTPTTQYIGLRFRKRFVRMRIQGNDLGSFWRLGRIKFRFGASGSR